MRRNLRSNLRGGVVLDLVIAAGLILVGAFALHQFGYSFHQLLHGARQFFTA
jgi:hypothetical protein